ncbi:hypothetical protein ACH4NT_05175 [Streptomyces lydicus]
MRLLPAGEGAFLTANQVADRAWALRRPREVDAVDEVLVRPVGRPE